MKTIGLIGGMSWESTLDYYRMINQQVSERLGGFHSAQIAMVSLNFQEIESAYRKERWERISEILVKAARRTEAAGADFNLICCNTMHKVATKVQEETEKPLLDMVDVTARKIQKIRGRKVGLLGTRFTMEDGFYQSHLANYRLEVIIPTEEERQMVDRVIFEELAFGVFDPKSRSLYQQVIRHLVQRGAEAVILGCTEIPMLLQGVESPVPLLNTTRLHALRAVEYALADQEGSL